MEQLFPGVHASPAERLSFAPSTEVRAFLLQRASGGNLLIYNAPPLAGEADAIGALGGAARRYLGHWHEAMFGCEGLPAPLHCHQEEREEVAKKKCRVAATFAERHRPDADLEIIPIPGHTSGSTAFLWDSGEHRCLFTADSVYLHDGEWIAAVLPDSSDRASYLASLELLKGLEFDVLIPWAASVGRPCFAMTDRADARTRLDAIIDRLRRGEDR